MKASAFEYHSPTTLDEALALLGQHGGDCRLLAGGQSLVPAMLQRLAEPGRLVDLNRLTKAERPTFAAGRARIPPLMRHIDFTADTVPGPLGRLLARLSAQVGALPVRVRGTFLGALAHADPASQWCLAAVTLNAEMTLRSLKRGARTVRAADFFDSVWTTALADDEMLVEAQIPLLEDGISTGYYQVGRPNQFPQASALVVATHDHQTWSDVRVGIGGTEPKPRRLNVVETMLNGQAISSHSIAEAAHRAASLIDPLTDPILSGDDRRDLLRACVERALSEAAGL